MEQLPTTSTETATSDRLDHQRELAAERERILFRYRVRALENYRRKYLHTEKPMEHAKYSIVMVAKDHLLIRDLGPWDTHPTVTNDVEWVVRDVAWLLRGRRLLYIDSGGRLDEILVEHGYFVGFQALIQPAEYLVRDE